MMTTAVVATTIGSRICFETITATCTKTIEIVSFLAKNVHPSFDEVNTLLVECDLLAKLGQIQQLVTEFHEKEQYGYTFKSSIKLAIADLDKVVQTLNDIVSRIKSVKDYHESMYFHRWRKTNCTQLIHELKVTNAVLNTRFNNLEKIISINHNLS